MATETLSIVITADSKGAVAGMKEVAAQSDKFKMSLQDLNTRLSLLKERLLQATDATSIKKIGASIRITTAQVEAQTAAYKKMGVEVGKATESATNGLTKAFSALRTIAYIVPGIGIAGIFNLAYEAIGKSIEKLELFKTKLTELQKSYELINAAVKEGNKTAGEEISTLKILYEAATNVNNSMELRLKAAKELKEEYPKQFANLTQEAILNGEAKTSYDELTASIIATSKAKAIKGKLDDIEAQRLDNEIAKNKILAVTNKQIADIKAPIGRTKFTGGVNEGGVEAGGISMAQQKIDIEKRRDIALAANKKIEDDLNAREGLLKRFAGSPSLVDAIVPPALEKELPTKIAKVKKEIDELKKLYEDYFKLFYQRKGLQAGANTVDQQSDPLGKTPTRFEENRNPAIGSGDITGITEQTDAQNKYNEAIGETALIMESLGPSIDNIFTALQNGQDIGEAVGEMFKQLAIDIAKAAAKALIFQLILSLIPGGAPAAGAIGATSGVSKFGGNFLDLFKGFFGGGKAQGGVSTGPKSGYLELLHGTEAVMTPKQMGSFFNQGVNAGAMQAMGGSNGQNITVTGRLLGNDIWLSQKRTDYNKGLTT